VRVAARASRFGLVPAVLLVLFGVSAAVAPGADHGDTGQHRVSVTGESASTAPSTYDDLQDWLRLSAGTLRAPATALPDTWWAVCPRATGGCALQGRSLTGKVDSTAMAAATPTPQSSRAPPLA
jgi:hypothetical protein